MKTHVKKNIVFWLSISPTLLLIFFFFIIPAFGSLFYSLTDQKLAGQAIDDVSFIGIDNYIRIFTDTSLHKAIKNTCILLTSTLIIQQSLGLLLALQLQKQSGWLKKIIHACLYSGWLMPEVVIAFTFFLLFSVDGNINSILSAIHRTGPIWFIDYPLVVIICALIWAGTANALLVFENALSLIPESVFLAAKSDGASKIKIFIHITIPFLKPSITQNSFTSILNTLGLFGIIYMLTGGGPLFNSVNLPVLIFRIAITGSETGYGLSLSFLFFICSMILSFYSISHYKDQSSTYL